MQRTITLAEARGDDIEKFMSMDRKSFDHAMGYLSTWGFNLYPNVSMYFDFKNKEIIASYRDEQQGLRFFMGAIFDGTNVTFNS